MIHAQSELQKILQIPHCDFCLLFYHFLLFRSTFFYGKIVALRNSKSTFEALFFFTKVPNDVIISVNFDMFFRLNVILQLLLQLVLISQLFQCTFRENSWLLMHLNKSKNNGVFGTETKAKGPFHELFTPKWLRHLFNCIDSCYLIYF